MIVFTAQCHNLQRIDEPIQRMTTKTAVTSSDKKRFKYADLQSSLC